MKERNNFFADEDVVEVIMSTGNGGMMTVFVHWNGYEDLCVFTLVGLSMVIMFLRVGLLMRVLSKIIYEVMRMAGDFGDVQNIAACLVA